MNKSLALASILIAGSVIAAPTQEAFASTASVVNVFEVEENSTDGHAIWLNGLKREGLASSDQFIFEVPGIFTEYDDGTATLTGRVFDKGNSNGFFDVDLTFKLINNYDGGVKLERVSGSNIYQEGGYDNMTDYALNEYSFYELKRNQSFLTADSGDYAGSSLKLFNRAFDTNTYDNFKEFKNSGTDNKYVGQLGEGANAKNTGMGFSLWHGYTGEVTYQGAEAVTFNKRASYNSTKSDINVDLTKIQSGNTAGTPEPLTILGSISALCIGGAFKKKCSKNSSKKSDLV